MLLLLSVQSCPTVCNPIGGSPPGCPVPGILQARTLEWVAISFSNAWKGKVKVKSLSCVRLSNPMDCSPSASSVHGIFQARVLEWGATAFFVIININILLKYRKIIPSGSESKINLVQLLCNVTYITKRKIMNLDYCP